ncbi:MAG: squalene/phytoene synthase family protein [Pseudomonadota bacterium]
MTAPALSELAERIRESDPDRFEAALFVGDEALREHLFALYVYNLELAKIPWAVSEPMIGLMRLQWWRDTVEEAAAGAPPKAHEVAGPLMRAIQATAMDIAPLLEMATHRERELEPEPLADTDAVLAYVDGTVGAVMKAGASLLAGADEPTQSAAKRVGRAHGIASLLTAVPAHAQVGRVMLPSVPEDRSRLVAGETPPALRDTAQQLSRLGTKALREARRQPGASEAHPAFLSAWRTGVILRDAMRPDVDLFAPIGQESPFRRRARLLWLGFSGRMP